MCVCETVTVCVCAPVRVRVRVRVRVLYTTLKDRSAVRTDTLFSAEIAKKDAVLKRSVARTKGN